MNNLMTCNSWIYPNKNEIFHYVISDETLDTLNIEIGKGTYNISKIETYILDYDNINPKYKSVNIESFSNDLIKGNIEIDEDGYLVTSIPYDEGFTIKVNDKVVDYEIVNTAFLGFKINKGKNNIEITYNTPWLKEGKLISIISLAIFVILLLIDKFKTEHE